MLSSPTIIDDYSSTTTGICYNPDDMYYNTHHSQSTYPNFALYSSSTNYTNPPCFPTYSNLDDDNKHSSPYSSLPVYNSMYYDQQQQQQHQMMLNKKKQHFPSPISQQQQQQQQSSTIKRGSSCEALTLCDVNNKRIRLDNESHHHLSHINYETNLPSDKIDLYPSTNNCYTSTSYPTEHPYHHHTSVIVDSQQYFLNGWNGAAAF